MDVIPPEIIPTPVLLSTPAFVELAKIRLLFTVVPATSSFPPFKVIGPVPSRALWIFNRSKPD